MTLMWADSQVSARRNLGHLYGTSNVLSVSEISLTEAKQLTAQDQQIKALKTKAKQLSQQAKLKKAQQSVTKAQKQLTQATAPTPITASNQ